MHVLLRRDSSRQPRSRGFHACVRGDIMDDYGDIPPGERVDRAAWFWRGVRTSFSLPGLILCSAFVGFAGLAREAGLSIYEAVFMVTVIWALPAKVVLVGAIMAGNSLPAAAFAVALSSVRLTPMVVALVHRSFARQARANGCSTPCPISSQSLPGCWRWRSCATCRATRARPGMVGSAQRSSC
ncbi:AzlC family ABC transporter permease [Mesorhizobium sp. J428]|uniref:AzlC family ABC transporter permease n=1 Tax=Mesorhizobium sp. J428 TaxID=2898440 RepID=UPI0035ADED8C